MRNGTWSDEAYRNAAIVVLCGWSLFALVVVPATFTIAEHAHSEYPEIPEGMTVSSWITVAVLGGCPAIGWLLVLARRYRTALWLSGAPVAYLWFGQLLFELTHPFGVS